MGLTLDSNFTEMNTKNARVLRVTGVSQRSQCTYDFLEAALGIHGLNWL